MKDLARPAFFSKALLTLMAVLTVLSGCKKDDDDNKPSGPGNIVQVASSNADFSALVAAVTKADLVGTLSGTTQLTVFAPNNAAFAKLPAPFNSAASISAITAPAQIAQLRNILLYHVVGGETKAAAIANGASSVTTQKPASATGVNDNTLYLSKSSAGVFINGSTRVITPDIDASNGVIHAIDNVLMAPMATIAGIVQAQASASSPQFTVLLAALSRPAAAQLFQAASANSSNLTVFAPTDAAFQALLTQLGANSLDDIDDATLVAVLQLHIVGSRAFSSDLSNGLSVPTLNGNLTIGVSGNSVTVRGAGNSTPANVTAANILATNGVIHVIDRVLLPQL